MATIGKFQLGAPRDSDNFLQLFAIVLDELEKQKLQGSLFADIPPALLLCWGENNEPTLADLQLGLEPVAPQGNWPIELQNNWPRAVKNGFQQALSAALTAAPSFRIESGRLICRLLAFVAQTYRPDNEEFSRRNRQIGRSQLAAARAILNKERSNSPEGPKQSLLLQPLHTSAAKHILSSPDNKAVLEEYLSTPALRLWQASHSGPTFAQKGENQDATYALTCDDAIAFALADGISTSYGARFAAKTVAFNFCKAASCYMAVPNDIETTIRKSVQSAQDWLNSVLLHLLDDPTAPEWNDVAGQSFIARDVALRLLDNTRTRQHHHWGPSLATTLIAGIARPFNHGWEVGFLHIGDGVVERWVENGSVIPLISMDNSQSEIDACISPSLDRLASHVGDFHQFSLHSTDLLLVSSDGLTRGHESTVTKKLSEIGTLQRGVYDHKSLRASRMLNKACEYADRLYETDRLSLFADNLSLIIIEPNLKTK